MSGQTQDTSDVVSEVGNELLATLCVTNLGQVALLPHVTLQSTDFPVLVVYFGTLSCL